MPRMDLKQNYRFTDGHLYRAGKGVQVPEGFVAWLSGPVIESYRREPAGPAAGDAIDASSDVTSPVREHPYADLLAKSGFGDWVAVHSASDDDLLAIDGIGPKRLAEIRDWEP